MQDLLAGGADMEEQGELARGFWYTPLAIAVYMGVTNVVQLLLDHHADHAFVHLHDARPFLHGDGRTILHEAVSGGDTAVLLLLLQHKVDVCAKDSDGCTPLMLAASHGGRTAVVLLL